MNPVLEAAEVAVAPQVAVVKAHVALIGFVVFVAILLAAVVYHKSVVGLLKGQIKTLTTENVGLTQDNAVLKANQLTLSNSLDKQSKNVLKWSKDQDEATAAANAAIAKAQTKAAAWKKKYDAILNSPKPDADDCKALNMKMDQYIEVRKQEDKP